MNRKWLTGLTLAGVAGSGGAAFAAVGETATKPAPAPASVAQAVAQLPVVTEASTATTASGGTAAETTDAPLPSIRTVTYQIGNAASLTIEIDGTQLTVREIDPSDGWSVAAISNSGVHVDVQFTDGTQIVGFVIDLVGSDPVVSVTNTLAPGASGPLSTDPVTVSSSDEDSAPSNPPLAAIPPTMPETTPPTTTAIVPMTPDTEPAPAPAVPSPAATTTTSAVVADESDDDAEHEDLSTEHEDHEDDGGEHDD
jgi:hypothetical protein